LRLSVVVPVLDEAGTLEKTLESLAPLRAAGHEVIVVDGGSRDGSPALARPLADRVAGAPRGRALQMNAGAASATGDVLLFLHADTRLPEGVPGLVAAALARGRSWGRFDVRLSGQHPLLRVVERMMSLRSCLTGVATGDQAIFVGRAVFQAVGGFAPIPLMEDVDLSRRLKRAAGRPACVRVPVVTSSRRWERDGIVWTVLRMWRLRLAYFLGADPGRLAGMYYRDPPPGPGTLP
jgi:rSAM/selenodomain-associated transferase 2